MKKSISALKLSSAEIEKIQLIKLKKLVHHAYSTVPYYHELFKKNRLKPDDIRTLDDIQKIPITSRSNVAGLSKDLITSNKYNIKELIAIKSSGTTGEPFSFYKDRKYNDITNINGIRSRLIHGGKILDRELYLGGVGNNLRISHYPFTHLFMRKVELNSLTKPQTILDFYSWHKPPIIQGYISNIYLFVVWLEENYIVLKPRPKLVICGGETAHTHMKQIISKILSAKVVDRYGSIELGHIAVECESGGGYHIFEDSVLAEFIKIEGKNHFVGTNLNNFVTPFIRYDTGDICEPALLEDNCFCGLKTKKIKKILGRENDFIKTPSGEIRSSWVLIWQMRKSYPFIKKYRFVQDSPDSIRLEIVSKKGYNEKKLQGLKEAVNSEFNGLDLKIQKVDEIPKDKSGKMRIVISNIK
jgi:phenylacetate-CoA ligase